MFVWHIYLKGRRRQFHRKNKPQPNITMVASLGNNAISTLKPGAVLTVSGAKTETDAQREVADFLQSSNRDDLGYFLISKDYFLLYLKSGSSSSGIA